MLFIEGMRSGVVHMLNLYRLHLLCHVARFGSITRAAQTLSYTASALSQQMSVLEREAGAQLLVRDTSGTRLTAAGKVLLSHAERINTEVLAAEAALAWLVQGATDALRLASYSTANSVLLPQAISLFQDRHRGVRITVVEADDNVGLLCNDGAVFADHNLDIALGYMFDKRPRQASGDSAVRTTWLADDRIHVALPPEHRLAHAAAVRLDDLRDERWVQGTRSNHTNAILPSLCRGAGYEPQIVARTDDQLSVRGMVSSGIGIALMSSLNLPPPEAGLRVLPLTDPPIVRRLFATSRIGVDAHPAAATLIRILRAVGRDVVHGQPDPHHPRRTGQHDFPTARGGATPTVGVDQTMNLPEPRERTESQS